MVQLSPTLHVRKEAVLSVEERTPTETCIYISGRGNEVVARPVAEVLELLA